jgi:hypothetical protein
MLTIEQFSNEMRVKRELRKIKLTGYLNAMQQPNTKKPADNKTGIKTMRDLVYQVYKILPHFEGPVTDTYDKKPRVFFGSQEEFERYTKDRPSYWPDDRIMKAYNSLSKMDYSSKELTALVALKKIFSL